VFFHIRRIDGSPKRPATLAGMHGVVREITWPAPNYARVVLGGDGLQGFEARAETDSYVNVAIPPKGATYAAPFDLAELKELPREQRPFRRRYTVRRWDEAAGELTLDVVVHGDDGAGGGWVARAQLGDALVFTGPAGGYSPDPVADWHLLVGDESVVPAIAASLEAMPDGAPVIVRVVCDGPDHEIELSSPGALDLAWAHRTGGTTDDAGLLLRAVEDVAFPAGRAHAFVHGEAGEARAVRKHMLAGRGLDPSQLHCSPYWRRGLDDEAWRQVKAAWNAEVEADVG
jgi:NADPH-dependent ferric siderophore reductase